MIGWILWALLTLAMGALGAWAAKHDTQSGWTWWLLVPAAVCAVLGGITWGLFFSVFDLAPFGGG